MTYLFVSVVPKVLFKLLDRTFNARVLKNKKNVVKNKNNVKNIKKRGKKRKKTFLHVWYVEVVNCFSTARRRRHLESYEQRIVLLFHVGPAPGFHRPQAHTERRTDGGGGRLEERLFRWGRGGSGSRPGRDRTLLRPAQPNRGQQVRRRGQTVQLFLVR